MKNHVGFIGLGTMGRPMAYNLLKKGFCLSVYDINPLNLKEVVDAGGSPGNSPAAIAREVPIVVTMLPDFPEVIQVLAGLNGLFEGSHPGMLMINASTMSPSRGRELAALAADKKIRLLESPVTRGIRSAIDGTLCFFISGSEADLKEARQILEAMGTDLYFIGPHGAALTLKLVNNILTILTNAIISESMSMGVKGGLDPKMILSLLKNSSAASYSLNEKLPRMIDENFTPGFAIDMAHKDLTLALQMASELGATLPLTALGRELYGLARNQKKGKMDTSALITLYGGIGPPS